MSELSSANRKALHASLRQIWQMGANVIVGWRMTRHGIEVLYLSSYGLPNAAKRRPNLLRLDRHIETEEEFEIFRRLGCKVAPINLLVELHERRALLHEINEIVRNYSVTHFETRAVALFDIVSFSLYSPFEQIVQVNMLSYYLKVAARRCRALGMPIGLCMTTTGDGFYVWNRGEGLSADIALFCAVVLALASTYAARGLAEKDTASVPRLRCCVHFGSHYEFHQGRSGPDSGGSYIVGDVTIALARLIGKARSGQLLVGSHVRDMEREDERWRNLLPVSTLDTPTFMALAQAEIQKIVGVAIPGGKIKDMNVYFTGPKISDDTFSIRKYYVRDKHGLDHSCYNAKITVRTTSGREVYFGLLDRELEKFDATFDEDEDILVRVA